MKKLATTQLINVLLILFAITLPLLFLEGCIGAGSSTAQVDISGTWTLSTQTGNFTFNQFGNTISGNTPGDQTISGQISGLNISFQWTDGTGTNMYKGQVSSNGVISMSGTYTASNGTSGSWIGTLSASSVMITTGNWSVTEIPTGSTVGTSFTVFLSQSTSTITGNFPTTSTGQPAAEGTQITGTVSNTSITFTFTNTSTNTAYTYTGTISTSNTIVQGTYTINNGTGGTWLASFTSSS